MQSTYQVENSCLFARTPGSYPQITMDCCIQRVTRRRGDTLISALHKEVRAYEGRGARRSGRMNAPDAKRPGPIPV